MHNEEEDFCRRYLSKKDTAACGPWFSGEPPRRRGEGTLHEESPIRQALSVEHSVEHFGRYMIDLINNDVENGSLYSPSRIMSPLKAESLPLPDYTGPMYPPRVSDAEVQAVIRELMTGQVLPSGAAVRATLEARFGSRGGVARIYRLLADERLRRTLPPEPGTVDALQIEVRTLREKLARAEAREEAHQSRWAAEVDQLRLKVAELETLAHQARGARGEVELLRHQLQVAQARASTFEREIYTLKVRLTP